MTVQYLLALRLPCNLLLLSVASLGVYNFVCWNLAPTAAMMEASCQEDQAANL